MTAVARTPFLIIGAGPFGLAIAACARARGLAFTHVGETMSFWTLHMPLGMLLRSGIDWHLDVAGRDTFHAFLTAQGIDPAAALPVSLPLYRAYIAWFMQRNQLAPLPLRVERLERSGDGFIAHFHDGSAIQADTVAAVLGMGPFAYVPPELSAMIPAAFLTHTVALHDPAVMHGQRILVVGGRQSAYESAALLAEAGARAVHVCHRHDTPAFEVSDWSWVPELVERTAVQPGWYRRLPREEREALAQRFWREGRARLEPWLARRIDRAEVTLHPRTTVSAVRAPGGGSLAVMLDDGTGLDVDHVICATGYRVELSRVPFLAPLLPDIAVHNGAPVLDDTLQSNARGLYFTSFPAAPDFGPWFGFTVSARASARIIVDAVADRASGARRAHEVFR